MVASVHVMVHQVAQDDVGVTQDVMGSLFLSKFHCIIKFCESTVKILK